MRVRIRLVAVGDEGQQRERFLLSTLTHGYIRPYRDAIVHRVGILMQGHPLAGRLVPTSEGDMGVAYKLPDRLLTPQVEDGLKDLFHDALAYVEQHGLRGAP